MFSAPTVCSVNYPCASPVFVFPPLMADDTVAAVAFRAPAFTSQDPSMWFSILETNFKASKITVSLTKFANATSVLPPDILSQVSDVIYTAATSDTPYEDLKTAILLRLQSTVATRLQELLSQEELGNERPSDLLHRMKNLLADKYSSFDTDLFKQLFYQRLPSTTQRSLFTVKTTLSVDALATLADEFLAALPPEQSAVTSITAQDSTTQLAQLVAQLSLQVRNIQKQLNERSRFRSSSPHRFKRQPRSGSNTKDPPAVCFYHRKFGRDAIKCLAPCTFHKSLNTNSEH